MMMEAAAEAAVAPEDVEVEEGALLVPLLCACSTSRNLSHLYQPGR